MYIYIYYTQLYIPYNIYIYMYTISTLQFNTITIYIERERCIDAYVYISLYITYSY